MVLDRSFNQHLFTELHAIAMHDWLVGMPKQHDDRKEQLEHQLKKDQGHLREQTSVLYSRSNCNILFLLSIYLA